MLIVLIYMRKGRTINGRKGSSRLRDLIANRGASVWDFDRKSLLRAFELMETYADRPMDLADASLIVAAEELRSGPSTCS